MITLLLFLHSRLMQESRKVWRQADVHFFFFTTSKLKSAN